MKTREGSGRAQPREKETWEGQCHSLQAPERDCSELGVGLISHVISNRTRGNALNSARGGSEWILQNFFHQKCGQALEQAAQRNSGITGLEIFKSSI